MSRMSVASAGLTGVRTVEVVVDKLGALPVLQYFTAWRTELNRANHRTCGAHSTVDSERSEDEYGWVPM
jgi:hypothetical protein